MIAPRPPGTSHIPRGPQRVYAQVVLLEAGPQYDTDEAKPIIWEHGRRNLELRAAGVLNIVCPIMDDSPLCGVGIFNGTLDEVRAVMEGDPGVQAGVFTYRLHPSRSFPGDALLDAR